MCFEVPTVSSSVKSIILKDPMAFPIRLPWTSLAEFWFDGESNEVNQHSLKESNETVLRHPTDLQSWWLLNTSPNKYSKSNPLFSVPFNCSKFEIIYNHLFDPYEIVIYNIYSSWENCRNLNIMISPCFSFLVRNQWQIQDFPDGEPLSLGQNPIICQDFCWKLHKNERNWTERGARP